MRYHTPIFSGLTAACLAACLSACAAEPPRVQNWQSATPLALHCAPGQDCAGNVDYRALHNVTDGRQVFLYFAGGLPPAKLDAAALAATFRYGDLYWPEGAGIAGAHLQSDGNGDGQVRFLPAPDGRLQAEVTLDKYKVVVERTGGTECRSDDVVGQCSTETVVKKPQRIVLDLLLPPPGARPVGK